MAKVFISYKRVDEPFVRRLAQALRDKGQEAWVDLTGIPPTAVFMLEIRAALEAAHAVIFVLSPESIVSEVCNQEVDHAVSHNKRLIPIVHREVVRQDVPATLAERNWIFFRESDDFAIALDTLLAAIATDLEWVHIHSRLTVRAVEWERYRCDASYTLRGMDLNEAEQRLASVGADQQVQPTALQRQYVLASRRAATVRQRSLLVGVSVALGVAIALGLLFLWQKSRAEERELAARRLVYGEMTMRSDESFERGDAGRARAYLENQQEDVLGFEWHYLKRRIAGGGRELFEMSSPNSDVPSMWPNSGILTAIDSGRLQQWNAVTGAPIPVRWNHKLDNLACALSPDGKTAAVGGSLGIELYDVTSGKEIPDFEPDEYWMPKALTFSLRGRYLACRDNRIDAWHFQLWDLERKQQIPIDFEANSDSTVVKPHPFAYVTSVAFAPDDSTLAIGLFGGELYLVDLPDGKLRMPNRAMDDKQSLPVVGQLAFSPDGRTLASAHGSIQEVTVAGTQSTTGTTNGLIHLWDVRSGNRLAVLSGHRPGAFFVRFSGNGRWLATAAGNTSVNDPGRTEVKIWDVEHRAEIQTLTAQDTGYPRSVSFSPDDSSFAVFGDDKVSIWDMRRKWKFGEFLGRGFSRLDLGVRSAGSAFHTVDDRGVVIVHDWNEAKERFSLPPKPPAPSAFTFAPDGKTIAVGTEAGTIRLYDAGTMRSGREWPAHSKSIRALAFSPDGTRLVSAGDDQELIEWDVAKARAGFRRRIAGVVTHLTYDDSGMHLGVITGTSTDLSYLHPDRLVTWNLQGEENPVVDYRTNVNKPILAVSSDLSWAVTTEYRLAATEESTTEGGRRSGETLLTLHEMATATERVLYRTKPPAAAPKRFEPEEELFVCAAFSPDGRQLAASLKGRGTNPILLFDLESGRVLREFSGGGESQPMTSLAFAPDGRSLVAIGYQEVRKVYSVPRGASNAGVNWVRVWDLETGDCIRRWTFPSGVNGRGEAVCSACSPTDARLLGLFRADAGMLTFLDTITGTSRGEISGTNPRIASVRINDEGVVGLLLMRDREGDCSAVYQGNLETWQQVVGPIAGEAQAVAFASKGGLLAVAAEDFLVRLFELETRRERPPLQGHSVTVDAVAFSPDGKWLASGDAAGSARIWEMPAGRSFRDLRLHEAGIRGLAFSPDGRSIASASDDGTVKVFEVANGAPRWSAAGHGQPLNSVAYSPDGRMLATGSRRGSGTVILWNSKDGREMSRFGGLAAGPVALAFAPDDGVIATGDAAGAVQLWDLVEGRPILSFQRPAEKKDHPELSAHSDGVLTLTFSPDGKMLATGGVDLHAKLWERSSGRLLATRDGHLNEIRSIAFVSDGAAVASAGADGSVKIWETDPSADLPLRTVILPSTRRFKDLALAEDGKSLALGVDDGTIQIWDLEPRRKRTTLYGYIGEIRSLAFSRDGKLLASESWDTAVPFNSDNSAVRVWDVASGRESAIPKAAEPPFARRGRGRPIFNDDGSLLASSMYEADGENRVVLWDRGTGVSRKTAMKGQPLAFSADGTYLVTQLPAGSQTAVIWDVRSNSPLRTLRDDEGSIVAASYSRDGRTVVTASEGRLKFWNHFSGAQILSVRGLLGQPARLEFAADGKSLLAIDGETGFINLRAR